MSEGKMTFSSRQSECTAELQAAIDEAAHTGQTLVLGKASITAAHSG